MGHLYHFRRKFGLKLKFLRKSKVTHCLHYNSPAGYGTKSVYTYKHRFQTSATGWLRSIYVVSKYRGSVPPSPKSLISTFIKKMTKSPNERNSPKCGNSAAFWAVTKSFIVHASITLLIISRVIDAWTNYLNAKYYLHANWVPSTLALVYLSVTCLLSYYSKLRKMPRFTVDRPFWRTLYKYALTSQNSKPA